MTVMRSPEAQGLIAHAATKEECGSRSLALPRRRGWGSPASAGHGHMDGTESGACRRTHDDVVLRGTIDATRRRQHVCERDARGTTRAVLYACVDVADTGKPNAKKVESIRTGS